MAKAKGGNYKAVRDTEVVYGLTSSLAHVLVAMRGAQVRTACGLTLSGIGDYRTVAKGTSVLPITCPTCREHASRRPLPPWERPGAFRPTGTPKPRPKPSSELTGPSPGTL